jgi:hypothetical protein
MRVHRMAPALLAALAAVSLWIAAPTRAEAQFSGTGSYDGLAIGAGIGGGLLIGVPSLIFTVADCVSFGQDSPFARGWAIFEVVYASFELLLGLGTTTSGIVVAAGGSDGLAVALIGLVPLAFGALHLAHGVWSLETLGSRPREGPSARISLVPATASVVFQW